MILVKLSRHISNNKLSCDIYELGVNSKIAFIIFIEIHKLTDVMLNIKWNIMYYIMYQYNVIQ